MYFKEKSVSFNSTKIKFNIIVLQKRNIQNIPQMLGKLGYNTNIYSKIQFPPSLSRHYFRENCEDLVIYYCSQRVAPNVHAMFSLYIDKIP